MTYDEELLTRLQGLSEDELVAIKHFAEWRDVRRDTQSEPEGDWWNIWMILAGRGFGKTRVGCETTFEWGWLNPDARILVCAPTYNDLKLTCFEGESGLLNVIPKQLIVPNKSGGLYNSDDMQLRLKNGAMFQGISGEEPERFRGRQFTHGWIDELAAMKKAKDVLEQASFCLRLGDRTKLLITTTPRPTPVVKGLVNRSGIDVAITRGTSYDNIKNLSPTFRAQIDQGKGTEWHKQEALGEIVDDNEAIIKRSWLRMWPYQLPLPQFSFLIMSLDTAFTEKTRDKKTGKSDPTACSVWGVFQFRNPVTDTVDDGIMLLDAWDERLGFPDLVKRVKAEKNSVYGPPPKLIIPSIDGISKSRHDDTQRKPDIILIEEKGSGISLIQTLRQESIPVVPYNPGRADKKARLHRVSHLFSQRMVWTTESRDNPGNPPSWANNLLDQLCSFSGEGSIEHDDYVDTTSQAMIYVLDKDILEQPGAKKQRKELEEDRAEELDRKMKAKNPYG